MRPETGSFEGQSEPCTSGTAKKQNNANLVGMMY